MSLPLKNISWTFAATVITALLQVAQVSLLARSVPVSDMGTISIILSIINMATIFQDVGFSSFLIYKQDISDTQRHTLYTLNALLGVALCIISLLVAGLIENFFNIKGFEFLFSLTSIVFVLFGLTSQPQALMIKAGRLTELAVIDISTRLSGFIIVVFMLYMGYGILSQVVAVIISTLFKAIASTYLVKSEHSMKFNFNWSHLKEPFSYGSFHLGSITIGQIKRELDIFIVARLLGAEALGYYSVAKELATKSQVIIRPILSKVVMPMYAERQENENALRSLYLRINWYISTLYGMACLFGIFLSKYLILFLYGEKFLSSQDIFIIFLLISFLGSIGLQMGVVAQSTGKTRAEFKWNVASTTIYLALLPVGAFFGASQLAFVVLMIQLLLTLLSKKLFIDNIFNVQYWQFIRSWLTPWLLVSIAAIYVIFMT